MPKATSSFDPKYEALSTRYLKDIVGTNDWTFDRNPHLAIQTDAVVYSNNRRPTRREIAANQTTIRKIEQAISKFGWETIQGGECDGLWANTEVYPDKFFRPGVIRDIVTGKRHTFPLASTDDDERGLAFHFEGLGSEIYRVKSNRWFTVEADTWRGRRRSRKSSSKGDPKGRYPRSEKLLTVRAARRGAPRAPAQALARASRMTLEISEK